MCSVCVSTNLIQEMSPKSYAKSQKINLVKMLFLPKQSKAQNHYQATLLSVTDFTSDSLIVGATPQSSAECFRESPNEGQVTDDQYRSPKLISPTTCVHGCVHPHTLTY